MTLNIISAAFANEDRSAAVLMTTERGAVAISEQDRPELWQLMMDWRDAGGTVEPFQAPAPSGRSAPAATAENRLRAFLRASPSVVQLLQSKGISPADLGLN